MSRIPCLAVAALAISGSLVGFGCSDQSATDPTALFTDLESGFGSRIRARDKAMKTSVPDAIHWASDIHDAIERASAEDKPIFISCHVRQNAGDSDCDV